MKQEHSLFSAIIKILRPLLRILLRNGIPYNVFAELAKWSYTDVASREFFIQGKKQTISRISTITGLTRKDVHRLRKMEIPCDKEAIERHNRAARVISGWTRDARFTDCAGNPLELPLHEGEITFADLVKAFSGDIPTRAILDELKHIGAVDCLEGEKIRLNARAYVPHGDDRGKLVILGTDVSDLITTIDHNLVDTGEDPFFQRKVSYDNIPEEAANKFKSLSADYGQRLLENLDRWLASRDRDNNPSLGGKGRKRVGMGIYYFEEDLSD